MRMKNTAGRPFAGVAAIWVATSWLALPAFGQAPAPGREPIHPPERLEERAKTRLRSVRLRIRPTGAAEFGDCLELGADDLKVTLRGKRVTDPTLIDLDRTERPNVHALLIDTSGSMTGKLEYVRNAALEYVAQLDPERERALVLTFDETVILWQAATADRGKLTRAIDGVRMAGYTSVLDGLVYTIQELLGQRERPVLLLLSDGVDTSSLNERHDVFEIAASRSDLMIFTIGLQLPPMVSNAPPGFNSTRGFLQRLAQQTHGKYFEAPTPSLLDGVYRRIREMLDTEAILDVLDPEPDAEPGNLRVTSDTLGCKVDMLGELFAEDSGLPAVGPPFPALPERLGLSFSAMWNFHVNSAHHSIDDACGPPDEDRLEADMERLAETVWFADVEQHRVSGCALDLIMETGLLYNPLSSAWVGWNGWIKLATRPFDLAVSDLESLPRRPEELMDALAVDALAALDRAVETDPRMRPAKWHARPYSDLPMIFHGRTFLEMRPSLAQALFLTDAYRSWTLSRLEAEAQADLETLERRLRKRAPQYSDEVVRAAVLQSPEAQRIVERAKVPRRTDLQRYLGAWLGDLPAHDLFVRWEKDRIQRGLDRRAGFIDPAFDEEWSALRRLFFVPSYARVLTLLRPVHDPQRDVIGYYRVVLPRPTWFLERLKGYKKHPEFTDLPLDLLPDAPLGYRILGEILRDRPLLAEVLREGGYRVQGLNYESLMKARKQNPRRVFQRTRVRVGLIPRDPVAEDTGVETLRIEADLKLGPEQGIPQIERLILTTRPDRRAGS
jgi:Mg-chelatase subunit ChlD